MLNLGDKNMGGPIQFFLLLCKSDKCNRNLSWFICSHQYPKRFTYRIWLCLISRSANSRLSDRVVQEKVEFYEGKNMGPNRRRIYALTKENHYVWQGEQIAVHYNEIVELLNDRENILAVPQQDA